MFDRVFISDWSSWTHNVQHIVVIHNNVFITIGSGHPWVLWYTWPFTSDLSTWGIWSNHGLFWITPMDLLSSSALLLLSNVCYKPTVIIIIMICTLLQDTILQVSFYKWFYLIYDALLYSASEHIKLWMMRYINVVNK